MHSTVTGSSRALDLIYLFLMNVISTSSFLQSCIAQEKKHVHIETPRYVARALRARRAGSHLNAPEAMSSIRFELATSSFRL